MTERKNWNVREEEQIAYCWNFLGVRSAKVIAEKVFANVNVKKVSDKINNLIKAGLLYRKDDTPPATADVPNPVSIDRFRSSQTILMGEFEELYVAGVSFFREIVDLTEGSPRNRSSDDESDGNKKNKKKKTTPLVNVRQRSDLARSDLRDRESALATKLTEKKKKNKQDLFEAVIASRAAAAQRNMPPSQVGSTSASGALPTSSKKRSTALRPIDFNKMPSDSEQSEDETMTESREERRRGKQAMVRDEPAQKKRRVIPSQRYSQAMTRMGT